MNKEIIIYRHKENKRFYLIRNWSICGGTSDTNWFEATEDIYEAIQKSKFRDKTIEDEFNTRAFPNELKAKVTIYKDFDFDGFQGKLKKELVFKVSEFEKITLVIKEDLGDVK